MPTVADARRDFTDLLGRAHFTDELIPIFRRNTPYAHIVSEKAGKFLEEVNEIAERDGMNGRDQLISIAKEVEEARHAIGLGTTKELMEALKEFRMQKAS